MYFTRRHDYFAYSPDSPLKPDPPLTIIGGLMNQGPALRPKLWMGWLPVDGLEGVDL